jgi:hypothetical protein
LATAREIVDKEGFGGLFGRGLQTRILANALQGGLFSVAFKFSLPETISAHVGERGLSSAPAAAADKH